MTSNSALETVQHQDSPSASTADQNRARPITLRPILTFVAVWLGGSWLVVGAMLHPILPGGWSTVAALLAAFTVPVYVLVRGLKDAVYPSALTRLFVLRPFWYAMLFSPLLAGAGMIGMTVGLPFGVSGNVARWSLAVSGAFLALVSLVGFLGTKKLVVKRLEVRLPRLPEAFVGTRIVQLSDLHVGPQTSRRFLRRIAKAATAAEPDIVVYTGDQVDDFAQDVEYLVAALGGISAPLGTYAIAGNHDVFAGWDAVHERLSKAGMTVLVNAAVSIERGGERIWVAGTGDPSGLSWHRGGGLNAAPDIERTLEHVPAGEPTIALAHNPALWSELARHAVDLTLSGHTHYGQLAIPKWGWNVASLFLDLSMGSHRLDNSLLYINPGTNYWGLPLRIGTPPEVTVLSLWRSADGEGAAAEISSISRA